MSPSTWRSTTARIRARSVRSLLEAQHGQFAAELGEISREQYVHRALELDNHGYRDKRLVFTVLATELGLDPALAPALTAYFFDAYAAHTRAFPEALRVLAALREYFLAHVNETLALLRKEQLEVEKFLNKPHDSAPKARRRAKR